MDQSFITAFTPVLLCIVFCEKGLKPTQPKLRQLQQFEQTIHDIKYTKQAEVIKDRCGDAVFFLLSTYPMKKTTKPTGNILITECCLCM